MKIADVEKKKIIIEEMERCKKILAEKRDIVEKLASELAEKETLDYLQIKDILGERPFSPDDQISKTLKEVD